MVTQHGPVLVVSAHAGDFEACWLVTAVQPVNINKSPATNVAGSTPLTPLL